MAGGMTIVTEECTSQYCHITHATDSLYIDSVDD